MIILKQQCQFTRHLRATFLFLFLWCGVHGVAHSNERQTASSNAVSSLKISGVTNPIVLQNIRSSLELYQKIQSKTFIAPTSENGWKRLIDSAEKQVTDAVKPYGYYQSNVDTRQLDDASLIMNVSLGEPVVVDTIRLSVTGRAENEPEVHSWLSEFPMRNGSILRQPDYDSAKSSLNKILRRLGYFDADFIKHEIVVNTQRTKASITLEVTSGVRYHYGEFQVVWKNDNSQPYSDKFLKRFISLNKGQVFDSQVLQKEQSDMSSSSYFASAELRPLFDQAEDGVIPIQVTLGAPKRLAYGASLGFGTDTGPRAGLSFENRRVNRLAHRFNLDVNGSTEKQSAVVNYSIPTNGSKRDGLNFFTSYINENSDVRDSRTLLAGVDFNRSLSERTQLSYGLSFRDEQFTESGLQQESQLLLPSLSWQTVNANDLGSPDRGYRLSASLRGADDSIGSDISFVQLNASAKSVFTVGRGRLLGRAQIGQTFIQEEGGLPTSLSFFAGGDHSVRGYSFESIGVADENGDLRGGDNLVTASIEYEQSIRGAFALAAFIDAGDAYDDSLDLNVGIGIGARWRLPFGAIRLDLASAQDLEGKPIRLHFTFGTDL